jgi:parallel beta-helix repeat protein
MKIKSRIQLVLWAVLFVVAMSFSAYGADGQIKIGQTASTTFPIVIDQPGSYVLTSNIVVPAGVNGIVINVDNVTIDLNGHAVIGPGKASGGQWHGISTPVYSYGNAVINGSVKEFSGDGIRLWGENNQVKDVRSHNNGYIGIYASQSSITNCTAVHNDIGISGSISAITGCIVSNNDTYGIHAHNSTVTNCTASYNGSVGILTNHEPGTVTNCTANYNGSNGINGYYSTITNCTAKGNTQDGIYAFSNCRVEGNNLRDNGRYGLFLSTNGYAIKNVASGNGTANFFDSTPAMNYMPTTGDNANYGF